jgi:hypothetical protein
MAKLEAELAAMPRPKLPKHPMDVVDQEKERAKARLVMGDIEFIPYSKSDQWIAVIGLSTLALATLWGLIDLFI